MAAQLFQICLSTLIVLSEVGKSVEYGTLNQKKDGLKDVFGKPEHGYFLEVLLGTPPQKFNVVVDTGSGNFAVAGSKEAGVDKFFDLSKSSSYSSFPGTSMSVKYANGSWSGVLVRDSLKLCETCSSSQVDIAMITSSANFFVSRDLWQGILGLGYQALIQPKASSAVTVLDYLYNDHVITDKIFSLTLCGQRDRGTSDMHGTIDFDAASTPDYIYTRIVREWYYQIEITDISVDGTSIEVDCKEINDPLAFVDSGTTNLILPTRAYHSVLAAIESYADNLKRPELSNNTLRKFLSRSQFLCVPPSFPSTNSSLTNSSPPSSVFDWFPELHLFIALNSTHQFSINLPPQQYIRQNMSSIVQEDNFANKTYCYSLAIEAGTIGTILGTVFMEQLNVIHDKKSRKVGFKVDNSTCNVSDPVFVKKISKVGNRDLSGKECLTTPGGGPPLASLLVTLLLFFTATLILVAVLFHRPKVQRLVTQCKACCCARWGFETKYSYMMNSDEDGDEDSILREDDNRDEVNLGYSSQLQLQVDEYHSEDDIS